MGKDEQFLQGKKINNPAQKRENGDEGSGNGGHGTPDPRGRYGQQIDSDITDYE